MTICLIEIVIQSLGDGLKGYSGKVGRYLLWCNNTRSGVGHYLLMVDDNVCGITNPGIIMEYVPTCL